MQDKNECEVSESLHEMQKEGAERLVSALIAESVSTDESMSDLLEEARALKERVEERID